MSLHQTPKRLRVTPTVEGNLALIPPTVILLGNADNDGSEEDPISLSCFLKSDTVEVCVATVRKKAHQSDVLYATWLDDQIHMDHDKVK